MSRFDERLRGELTSMRERHHSRFRDATAKLREQHREVVEEEQTAGETAPQELCMCAGPTTAVTAPDSCLVSLFLLPLSSPIYLSSHFPFSLLLSSPLPSKDAMTELNSELHLRQGLVGELKSSLNVVRLLFNLLYKCCYLWLGEQ